MRRKKGEGKGGLEIGREKKGAGDGCNIEHSPPPKVRGKRSLFKKVN